MQRLLTYLSDTRGELKHVSWPTQRQTIIYTTLVVVVSVLTALYLGALDHGLTKGLNVLITRL